jgi:hypothetical protein
VLKEYYKKPTLDGTMKKIMAKLTALKPLWAVFLFTLINVIFIGMGMGVPFFCILMGIPLGWFLVLYVTARTSETRDVMWKVLIYAAIAAGITMVGMLIIWLPISSLLFDPGNDLSTTGVPLILYEPRASFIGWLGLMIVVSPVLQLLTTLFGAWLTLLGWLAVKITQVKTQGPYGLSD